VETVHDIIERLLNPVRLTVEEVEEAKAILAKAREAEAPTDSADTPEEAPAPDTLA
jgi:hypothetical protein